MSDQSYVFGIHAVQALLNKAPERITHLYLLAGRQDKRMEAIASLAKQAQINIVLRDRNFLDQLCEGQHQGVVALAQASRSYNEQDLMSLIRASEHDPLILVLDGVTDPHNLGACMRTADAVGVDAVVVPKDNSAGLNDVARKVACGAAETVPLVVVTNLARCLKKMQDLGIWLIGTDGDASKAVYDEVLTGPRAVIMGAEGKGMRRLTRELCDDLVFIPMQGSVSSLNVSVATGVVLYEVLRQRKAQRR